MIKIQKTNTVLDKAKSLIYGDRAKEYGSATKNLEKIALGWSLIVDSEVSPHDVCLMMDWLKTCRLVHQNFHDDSIVDKAGYSGLLEKLMRGE